jgi:uncharacterized membrane protein
MPSWDLGWHHQQMAIGWIVVALAVALIFSVGWRGWRKSSAGGESPEQVLKRRYASGEIDEETYHNMLAELRK